MAKHNELGKAGEDEAVRFLEGKGYTILHRNWRSGRRELDIVARWQDDVLVVVEVKTRQDLRFGNPEEAVTNVKIRKIVAATDAYLRLFETDLPVRFDVITIVGKEAPFHIEHIEDAFYPPVW